LDAEKLKCELKFYIRDTHHVIFIMRKWRFSMCVRVHEVWCRISPKPLDIEARFQTTTNRNGESKGHVTNDVMWPWKVKVVTPIYLESNVLKTAGDRLRIPRATNMKLQMANPMATWSWNVKVMTHPNMFEAHHLAYNAAPTENRTWGIRWSRVRW